MQKVYIQRQKMLTFWKLVSDFSEGVWAYVQGTVFFVLLDPKTRCLEFYN